MYKSKMKKNKLFMRKPNMSKSTVKSRFRSLTMQR